MAKQYNFKVDQGATWTFSLIYKDESDVVIDLTGYTVKMHLRVNVKSAQASKELSTDVDGGVVVYGSQGEIVFTLSATETSELSGSYVYDIEITSPQGVVTRLLQGNIVIDPEVTR